MSVAVYNFDRCIECVSVLTDALQLLMLIVNTLRYVFLRGHVGHWSEMLLVLQVSNGLCYQACLTSH